MRRVEVGLRWGSKCWSGLWWDGSLMLDMWARIWGWGEDEKLKLCWASTSRVVNTVTWDSGFWPNLWRKGRLLPEVWPWGHGDKERRVSWVPLFSFKTFFFLMTAFDLSSDLMELASEFSQNQELVISNKTSQQLKCSLVDVAKNWV